MREKKYASSLTLTVVVAVYNEEETIAKCLRLIHEQREWVDSVIVVDNNSTDNTVRVVQQLGFPEVQIIHEQTPGLIPARNAGFRATKTDLVARVDADTYVEPGWAKSIIHYFSSKRHATIWIASGRTSFYDLPFREAARWITDIVTKGGNLLGGGHSGLYGCSEAGRTKELQRVIDETCTERTIMEDLDMVFHILKLGGKIGMIPRMKASTSARRLTSTPRQFWKYNSMWYRTYFVHRQWLQGAVIFLLVMLTNVLHLLVWPIIVAYNPSSRRLSLRYASENAKFDRCIP